MRDERGAQGAQRLRVLRVRLDHGELERGGDVSYLAMPLTAAIVGSNPFAAAARALALPQCPVLRHVTVMDWYPRVPRMEPGFVALRKAAQQIRERCIKEAAEEKTVLIHQLNSKSGNNLALKQVRTSLLGVPVMNRGGRIILD